MPPADPAPSAPGDPELERLLTAHEDQAAAEMLFATDRGATEAARDEASACLGAARAAVIAHIAAAYVRRDRLHDDGPFDPGDGSAYGAALAPDPPIVAGPNERRAVTVRVVGRRAPAIRYRKEELTDGE